MKPLPKPDSIPDGPERLWQGDLAHMLGEDDCPAVIVVEHPAGAGKTHVARLLAEAHVDAWHVLEACPMTLEWAGSYSVVFVDTPTITAEMTRAALESQALVNRGTVLVFMGADCSAVREELRSRAGLTWAWLTEFDRLFKPGIEIAGRTTALLVTQRDVTVHGVADLEDIAR